MAIKMTKITLFVFVLATVFWSSARAQTGCTRTLMALSPCLNYVTGNTSTPTASCCSQLSNVVTSQPQCLCLLLNGTASSYGFNINQTLALQLPDACKVQTPPTSRCNSAGNAPSASPDTRQSPPTDSSDQPGTIPSGSKTVPSTSGVSNVGATSDIAVFLLLIASCALSLAGF